MQMKINQVPKYVLDGVKDVKVYITKDGREFAKESDATIHENKILKREAFAAKYSFQSIEEIDENHTAIYVHELNEENKKEICEYFPNLKGELKVGWNLISFCDGGDYPDSYYTHPIEYYINDANSSLLKLQNLKDQKV